MSPENVPLYDLFVAIMPGFLVIVVCLLVLPVNLVDQLNTNLSSFLLGLILLFTSFLVGRIVNAIESWKIFSAIRDFMRWAFVKSNAFLNNPIIFVKELKNEYCPGYRIFDRRIVEWPFIYDESNIRDPKFSRIIEWGLANKDSYPDFIDLYSDETREVNVNSYFEWTLKSDQVNRLLVELEEKYKFSLDNTKYVEKMGGVHNLSGRTIGLQKTKKLKPLKRFLYSYIHPDNVLYEKYNMLTTFYANVSLVFILSSIFFTSSLFLNRYFDSFVDYETYSLIFWQDYKVLAMTAVSFSWLIAFITEFRRMEFKSREFTALINDALIKIEKE